MPFTLYVHPSVKLYVLTSSLPNAVKRKHYSANLVALGGSPQYTWKLLAGGKLPVGLKLKGPGQIVGTPNEGRDLDVHRPGAGLEKSETDGNGDPLDHGVVGEAIQPPSPSDGQVTAGRLRFVLKMRRVRTRRIAASREEPASPLVASPGSSESETESRPVTLSHYRQEL